MSPMLLSTLSAIFNLTSFFLLGFGFLQAKKGQIENHKKLMTAALISSGCFLVFYLTNRILHGEAPYPYHDWTRPLYLWVLLLPHVTLAVLITPFVIATAILGYMDKRRGHRRLAKFVLPIWVYVSLTGVLVYLSLRIQPMLRTPPPVAVEAVLPLTSGAGENLPPGALPE